MGFWGIEASLISKETGVKIIGKPYFDEGAFENNSTEKTSRRLSDSIPKVDKTINNFYETLKILKETKRGRKLFADDLNDKEKGFSWTIALNSRFSQGFCVKGSKGAVGPPRPTPLYMAHVPRPPYSPNQT